MDKAAIPFWEETYKKENVMTFSVRPNKTIYDWIMSFATLCFVRESEWKQFINKAKDNTNVGGIHIMHIFTDTVPASADIAPFAIGLAHDGEIKEMYTDWEILQFQSYVFEDEHPNVPKHKHAVNKIVARKGMAE